GTKYNSMVSLGRYAERTGLGHARRPLDHGRADDAHACLSKKRLYRPAALARERAVELYPERRSEVLDRRGDERGNGKRGRGPRYPAERPPQGRSPGRYA